MQHCYRLQSPRYGQIDSTAHAIEQINYLGDCHGVEGAGEHGFQGGFDAILFRVHEGQDAVHPRGADYMPAFVPLLHMVRLAVSAIQRISKDCFRPP